MVTLPSEVEFIADVKASFVAVVVDSVEVIV